MVGATQPVFVIVDRHPIHKSELVHDYVAKREDRLNLFYLPLQNRPEQRRHEEARTWRPAPHPEAARTRQVILPATRVPIC